MITIVFPFDYGELSKSLLAEGVAYETPEESNFRYDDEWCRVLIDIAQSPYAIPSLSAAIVAYLRKDTKRKAVVKKGDVHIDLSGHSAKDVERMLNTDAVVNIITQESEDHEGPEDMFE